MLDDYNEEIDNIHISAVPDLLIINSGVYDLTIATGGVWGKIESKDSIRSISPIQNIRKVDFPILMIHGTNDVISPYWTAERFFKEMSKLIDRVELKTIDGADHYFGIIPGILKKRIEQKQIS